MGAISLNIDRRGKHAVISESNTGKVDPLPTLSLGDTGQEFIVKILDPTGNSATPFYEKPDLNSYGLRIAVCQPSVGGSLGAVLAIQTSFSYDSINKTFSGLLDLSTVAIISAMAGEKESTFKLEISLTGVGRQHVLTKDILVQAVADIAGATIPTPTDSYRTANESDQRYVAFRLLAGQTITLVNSTNTKEITLGCDADGNLSQNQANV